MGRLTGRHQAAVASVSLASCSYLFDLIMVLTKVLLIDGRLREDLYSQNHLRRIHQVCSFFFFAAVAMVLYSFVVVYIYVYLCARILPPKKKIHR